MEHLRCQVCMHDKGDRALICEHCHPEDNSAAEVLRFLLEIRPDVIYDCYLLQSLLERYGVEDQEACLWIHLAHLININAKLTKGGVLTPEQLHCTEQLLITGLEAPADLARECVLNWAYALEMDLSLIVEGSSARGHKHHRATKKKSQQHLKLSKSYSDIKPLLSKPKPSSAVKAQPIDAIFDSIGQSFVEGQSVALCLPGNVSFRFIWCPAGSFLMGSPEGEIGRLNGESLHRVELSQGFWLGALPVTQEQYLAVMQSNPSWFSGRHLPVERVSWREAMAFCSKLQEQLSNKLPKGYSVLLPSEAQWEYACRAGSKSSLNSGKRLSGTEHLSPFSKRSLWSMDENNENLAEVSWYRGNSGGTTHSVGEKLANAWGLYDMHGNVEEWCSDWYGDYQGDECDPFGPNSGEYHVIRGGSWNSLPWCCRSAFRSYSPELRDIDLGFRVAVAPLKVKE